jgi:hypothetical protein
MVLLPPHRAIETSAIAQGTAAIRRQVNAGRRFDASQRNLLPFSFSAFNHGPHFSVDTMSLEQR